MRIRERVGAMSVLVCLAAVLAVGTPVAPAVATTPATFTSGGSINQVYTYGHAVGAAVDLLDSGGAVAASGVADAQGAYLFKGVTAGSGYRVEDGDQLSSPLTVTNPDDNPPQSFYKDITLHAGFGYLPTRDGTLLSINVTMPTDGSSGPWPVVVDYSGYDPSQPGGPPQEAAFYPYRGYVTVGINMRGTTCSGGAFDFFEPAQSTDGYDAVEALANQSWSNGNVGLVGISYSGYSQLYVAATRPPHLRAITPLSPFGDTYRGILYPGGILNKGFALGWAAERQADSAPAAHGWVRNRIAQGDTTCKANQVMRLQSRDLLAEIRPGRFDERPLGDYLDPTTFVDKIDVPTYLASQFQDEQTGGSATELATVLQSHPKFKAVFTNGTHVEPLGPTELPRVLEFIDFYVGHKVPALGGLLRIGVPPALQGIFGGTITLPFDRFTSYPNYDAALAAYEAEPKIRIRWQNGGKAGQEGSPYSTYDTGYSSWPIASVSAERWYLQPDGQLASTPPTVSEKEARGSSSYTYDPTTKRRQSFDGGTDAMWLQHPNVHWNPLAEGNSLSFTTPAYATRTAYAGTGSVDLWVKSTAADTDFEAELTEVFPDGHEQLIQSGWLRASRRRLDPARSTVLLPYETHVAPDAAPLPAGQFVPVRIPLFPFAQILTPGAKLRLNIEAPGGNQPFWAFDDLPGTATNSIAHSYELPSSVALPRLPADPTLFFYTSFGTPNPCVVAGVTTQAVSYRGQPCRAYHPARVATGVTAARSGSSDVAVSWTPPAPWADGTGGTLTGFDVIEQPTGRTVHVGAGVTSATFADAPRGVVLTYIVRAVFGSTAAPASDASPGVQLPDLTTTTTTPPTTVTVPTVPGGGPSTTTTTTAPAAADRWIVAVYRDLLGRTPDAGAIVYWQGQLAAGVSRTRVAQRITSTYEYQQDEVRAVYRALLDRSPSSGSLAASVAVLRHGGTLDDLRARLIGSAEFWAKAGSSPEGFARSLFQRVLGRSPSAASTAAVARMLGGGATTTEVGTWLVHTHEADVRLVTGWYRLLLDRAPTAAEGDLWVSRLAGGRSEATVVAQLTATTEYIANA